MDKKRNLWRKNLEISENLRTFAPTKGKKEYGSYRLDRDTHQKKYRKLGAFHLSMAGHFPCGTAAMPVDYNDGEHPNLMQIGVFITITIRPFFIFFSPFVNIKVITGNNNYFL